MTVEAARNLLTIPLVRDWLTNFPEEKTLQEIAKRVSQNWKKEGYLGETWCGCPLTVYLLDRTGAHFNVGYGGLSLGEVAEYVGTTLPAWTREFMAKVDSGCPLWRKLTVKQILEELDKC